MIKFCVRLQKSGVETLAMLRQCYGDRCLGRAMILRWHTTFTADLEQLAALQPCDGCEVSVQTDSKGRFLENLPPGLGTTVRDCIASNGRYFEK